MGFRMRKMAMKLPMLAVVLAMPQLSAQSLWLPGSDPATLARSGAGVAFGRSLEASAMNPALLPTMTDRRAAHLGLGLALESHLITPQSNQITHFSSERNRFMPSFGVGWKVGSKAAFGVHAEDAFRRHGRLDWSAPTRFDGLALDLDVKRAEFQAAFAMSPAFSLGFGAGVYQIAYDQEAPVRLIVPGDPGQSLVEVVAGQKATKTVPSLTLGFCWALGPRWTLGGSFRSGVNTELELKGRKVARPLTVVASDGYGVPTAGVEPLAQAYLDSLTAVTGDPTLKLPAQLQVGIRNRLNQLFTWELDVHFVGATTRLPGLPGMQGNERAQVVHEVPESKGGAGVRAMGEFNVSKTWKLRVGLSLDPAFRHDDDADVLSNGTRTAAFSAGLAWQVMGGELSLGYQFRQTQDRESNAVDANWTSAGYRRTGTLVRIEGQGHLASIGFRKTF